MKHLIVIHMVSRDRYWAEYIRGIIEEKSSDNQVKIITFDQIATTVIKEGFKPDSILTYTLRDELSVLWMTILKILTGAKIVVYENEGLMNFDDLDFIRKRVGIASRSKKLVDRYFYWGEKSARVSAKILLETGFVLDEKSVSYCGYVNYEMKSTDITPLLTENEKDLLNRIQKHCKNKKMVLVLTGFPLIDLSDEEFKSDGEIITNDENELHKYAESRRNMMKTYRSKYISMVKTIARENPDIPFVVKPHPAENERIRCKQYYLDEFKDLPNVMVLNEAIIVGVLLDNTELLIHYGSTVALESYIRGIPTLIYKDESYKGNSGLMQSSKTVRGEVFDNILEGLEFKRFEENDTFIYELFNYRFGEEYRPSDGLISAMEDQSDRYSVEKKDLLAPISKKRLVGQLVGEAKGCLKKGELANMLKMTKATFKVL